MADDRDIIDVLLEDHQEFRTLFSELETADPHDRQELFAYAVERLASHEAAEEALVHRTVRDHVPEGREIAEAVLAEEADAEQLLKDMTEMEPDSQEFIAALARLRDQVLEHAQHEERDEFPRIREHLSADRRQDMGRRFQRICEAGPSRPHPGTPQTPEVRAALGPIVGAFDRARDTVREAFPD